MHAERRMLLRAVSGRSVFRVIVLPPDERRVQRRIRLLQRHVHDCVRRVVGDVRRARHRCGVFGSRRHGLRLCADVWSGLLQRPVRAPYAPTGVAICQPSSGCHATGDTCTQDSDCCGGPGLPGGSGTPATCAITPPATTGFCRVPMGCNPDGELCKLATESCNRLCDCCSGNCTNQDTCKPDEDGVARCAAATCVAAGGSCASSANCCNGAPCVPNPSGTPPFVCLASTCAAAGERCTANADCCAGATCVAPVGSARGTCTQ